MSELCHLLNSTVNPEQGVPQTVLGKGDCVMQMQSCYLSDVGSAPCLPASTL